MLRYYDWSQFSAEDILVYLRKSRTDDPTMTVEEVLEKHEEILDDWAERNLGERVPDANKYREVESGETIDDRPEIKKLLKMVESPRYKAILIVEVQRLSRGDLEDAGRLIKLLRYSDTLIITPQKTYDLHDEYDRDTFERELKRGNDYLEYTKKIMDRGKLLSVSQGNYIGSKPPYGYDRDVVQVGKRKCPTLKINEEEANIVRMVFDLYVNQGMGATAICNHLDALGVKTPKGRARWSTQVIFSLLENIHYLGKVRWNWRKTLKTISDQEIKETRPKAKAGEYLIYDGRHPSIISQELFDRARDVRGSKPKTKKRTILKNPLAGLVRCSCGAGVGMNTYVNNGVEYANPRLKCRNQARCKSASVDLDEVLEQIKDTLRECIRDFEVRIDNQQDNSAELHNNLIARLQKQMAALEVKELEQWDLRSSGEMPKPIFDQLHAKLIRDKEDLRNAICAAYDSAPKPIDYRDRIIRYSDALRALEDDSVPAKAKNAYLKDIIDRIEYSRPPMIKMSKAQAAKAELGLEDTGYGWYARPYTLDIIFKN